MFYYLDGIASHIGQNLAVIDIGGVGYACMSTTNTLSKLETGKKAKLFIFTNVKEDAFDLYGFFDLSEKRCFEQLISVSGVGPKAALSILSSSSPESLALAIMNDDESVLTMAPGVGKKLASRIILELKDKVSKELPSLKASGYSSLVDRDGQLGSTVQDATAALTVLGYTQAEIAAALRSIDVTGLTTEEIVRTVLKSSA